MNGTESTKVKTIVELISKVLGLKLSAIIFAGSFSVGDYEDGWSDIDLLIVVESLDFDIKAHLSEVKQKLEHGLNVPFGINCITLKESVKPILATKSLDGKTLQTLHELEFNPERLIYYNGLTPAEIYIPNRNEVKEYSLNNVMFFLLRNRKELAPESNDDFNAYKNRLKKEIRACFTMTKLAVQYFEDINNFEHEFIIKKSKQIFKGFDFKIFDLHLYTIKKWGKINQIDNIIELYKWTDEFIESFSKFFIEMILKDRK